MVAFAGQADVLKGADTSGAVAIVEVTTDWSAGSSVISCSSWFQVVTKGRTGTIFRKMSGSLGKAIVLNFAYLGCRALKLRAKDQGAVDPSEGVC